MTIKVKNGVPIIGPNATIVAARSVTAPNNFDWKASKVRLEKDSEFGPFRTIVGIDATVIPPENAYLVFYAEVNGEDVHRTHPFPEAPVVGDNIILDDWSISNLPGATARLFAANENNELGVSIPLYFTEVEHPGDVVLPDVELIDPPILSPDPQEELGPVGFTPGTYDGTPTSTTYRWEDSEDGSTGWTTITGSDSSILSVWPLGTRAFVRVVEIVTGQGIATTLETTSAVIGVDPTEEEELNIPEFSMESYIVFTGASTYIKPKLNFTNAPPGTFGTDWWVNWSTDSQFPPRPQQVESGPFATVEVPPGAYEIHMDTVEDDGDPNEQSPRLNFSVFESTPSGVVAELGRAANLQIQYETPTQIGAWSAKRVVPDVLQDEEPATPYTTGDWARIVERYQGQYESREFGGQGAQFLRGFGIHEDETIVACMDQNLPWISHNFGGLFDTPKCVGAGSTLLTGCAAWIDPDDSDHWIVQYSEGSFGIALNRNSAVYGGLFRTLDGGDTLSHVAAFGQHGTQTDRGDKQYGRLAHDPTTSGSSRHIYSMQTWGSTSSSLNTIQLWRSTDNGATWATHGPNLSAATYGSNENGPNWIGFSDDGQLYMCGPKGAFKSSDKGATSGNWSSLHGTNKLPTGQDVRWMNVYGTGSDVTIWACPRGGSGGLYKSTNNGTTFTKISSLGTVNIDHFNTHPADRDQIYVIINGTGAKNSINGGTTWFNITSLPIVGQEQAFESRLWGQSTSVWPHPTDPQQTFWHRFQHLGSSETSHRAGTGENAMIVHFNGNNYNGIHWRGAGFHPTDWRKFFAAPQDKVGEYTESGGLYWINDCYTKSNAVGDEVVGIIGPSPSSQGMANIVTSSGRVVQTVRGTAGGGGSGSTLIIVDDPENADSNLTNRLNSGDIRVVDTNLGDVRWYAGLDKINSSIGYVGPKRLNNLNSAASSSITVTDMNGGRRFIGAANVSGSSVIFGHSGSTGLYRSTNNGSTFSHWYTTLSNFSRVGGVPVLGVDPTDNRMFAAASGGRVVRIEGASPAASSERVIFDPRMPGRAEYMSVEVEAGSPPFYVSCIAVDPNDPETVYVSMYMWGVSKGVFMTRNAVSGSGWINGQSPGATPVIWEDITQGVATTENILFVHPLTSDLFYTTSHGAWVRSAPSDTRQALSVTPYAFKRVNVGSGTVTSISGAVEGAYVLTCTTAGGSGVGKFSVVGPDDNSLGIATVGTAFSHSEVNFTINDGTPDFAIGDRFVISRSVYDINRDFIRGIV